VSGALLVVGTGEAQAATQIGETFVPNGNCSPRTRIQSASPGGQYAAPAAGVITSWSFQSSSSGGGAPVKLKVARAAGGDNFTVVGESESQNIPGVDALHTFPVRITVQQGDLIGLSAMPASVFLCSRSATGYTVHESAFGADVAVSSTQTFSSVPDRQLGVSALLEADADQDGFGDETQDQCATDATTQGPCPDTDPPETTITKGAPKKTEKRKVKFRFISDEPGSTFECKLDKGPFEPCTSPRKVKHLDPGQHTFRVRATDPAGNADATPAKDKFKVVAG
jgi:hypothetical protein